MKSAAAKQDIESEGISQGVTGAMTGRATPRIYSIDVYTPSSVNIISMSTRAEYHSSACSSTGTV
jgi:hypothetical protein